MCLEKLNNFLVTYNDIPPDFETPFFKLISNFRPNSKEYLPQQKGWHKPTGISVILTTSWRQTNWNGTEISNL